MTSADSIDFQHSFREEAREILVELEACLLELNESPANPDLVGRAFRGLHTIKGSGAMFGFEALAAFTHELENAFDEVRNGRAVVSAKLVDLTLAALDQIRRMVEADPGKAPADAGACAAILAAVRAAIPSADLSPQKGHTGKTVAHETADTAAAEPDTIHSWRIRFAPGPELMRRGTDPLLLLCELGELGELSVEASMAALPALEDLEPDRCYAHWEMQLETSAGEDAIQDVFIFVEDCCELVIEPVQLTGALGSSTLEPSRAADAAATALKDPRCEGGRRSGDQPGNAASLRVPAAKLDQLVDLVGERVTAQARLSSTAGRLGDPAMLSVAEEVERLTAALRDSSMNLRMVPVRPTFEKFRRLVHDLARDLNKEVELTIEGADTELDKSLIDQLSDPLMHLIRNSMDHGIEPPEQRIAQGRNRTATIHLSALHSGASVLIAVSDDGAGIDREAVRARAIERGLTSAGAELSDAEIYSFIFQAGFSTAKQVTDLSGRGVGMDVVRRCVEGLHGTIDVASGRGEGTTVTLRLPLTLAIIDGLLVKVGEEHFVLPLASTLECIELTRQDAEQAHCSQLAYVRGEAVPYIRLRHYFGSRSAVPEREQIMIVESDSGRCGLVVDQVLGTCQTVIRNLGRLYRQIQTVSGATILGDGTLALILDPHRLVLEAVRAQGQPARGSPGAGRGENGHPREGP